MRGGYIIKLSTRKQCFSGSFADLKFRLYGTLGKSTAHAPLVAKRHRSALAAGAVVTLEHGSLPYVGDIFAIRLSLMVGAGATWPAIDEVQVDCLSTATEYKFQGKQPESHGDGSFMLLEYPKVRNDGYVAVK